MNVFIDTQLWVYAFKKPRKEYFNNSNEYEEALHFHKVSSKLIHNALLEHTIYTTTHQLAEIYHVLAFRGIKMNTKDALNIIESISRSSRVVLVEVKRKHYIEALRISSMSGIHVWDYLCLLPLKDLVEVAYTNDKHFLHPTLRNLVRIVENPLGKWLEI